MRISSAFDSGSIEVVDIHPEGAIRLNLRRDHVSDPSVEIRQWFHFRLQGARCRAVTLCILNAGAATYPAGWKDYQACASYDRVNWFRVSTGFDGTVMTISHTPTRDSIYYAYFEPYSWERHLELLGRAEDSPLASVDDLGATPEGRDLNRVRIGSGAGGKKQIWITARQHPGETMAEWLVEGMIERLLDGNDPASKKLLAAADFHIVPNMNPDGSVNGNLRVSTTGANLNREWVSPSEERSPEVLRVRNEMERTGCDFFLDVHGDEIIPYVFAAGCEMLPSSTAAQNAAQQRYLDALVRAAPDFQLEHGYPAGRYSEDALKLASKWVGHRFGCISLTLELPFKDNFNRPDAVTGWNGARSKVLGGQVLVALAETIGR